MPEVVAFAGSLTDTGEHGESAVVQCDIVDELHDDDGLADAGAAEKPDFSTLAVRFKQVHHLDARFEHFRLGVLILELRRRTVNRIGLFRLDRPFFVNRLTQHIDEAAQRFTPDRHRDRRTGIHNIHASGQTICRRHRDAADAIFTKMRRNFQSNVDSRLARRLIGFLGDLQRIVDIRQLTGRKLRVHNRSDDLDHFTCAHLLPLCSNAQC